MSKPAISWQLSAFRKTAGPPDSRPPTAGLTLVEAIVAVTIVVTLIVSSGVLYTTAVKIYTKDQLAQDVQRESDAIVNSFSTSLRDAVSINAASSNFSTNPNTLAVNISASQTRRYYVAGGQLHYVNESGSDLLLLQPNTTVTSLTFTTNPAPSPAAQVLKSITIALTLSRTKNNQTTNLVTSTTVGTRPQLTPSPVPG